MRSRTKITRAPRSNTRRARPRFGLRFSSAATTTALAVTLVFPAVAMAGAMDEADFYDPAVTTFDDLGLGFMNEAPVVIDGHTFDTDNGMVRYLPSPSGDCVESECVGNHTDGGYLDIVLGEPMRRVGLWVGASAATVAFFDEGGVLLGSVEVTPVAGETLDFAGWHADAGSIGRIRITDNEANSMVVTVDNLMVEDSDAPSPSPSPSPDQVVIDIRPGSDKNPINRSASAVPVAILSNTSFDASDVDPTTVTLEGAPVRNRGNGDPSASLVDVDGDGDLDLLLLVDARQMTLAPGDVEARLIGATYAGTPFEATDTVWIVR